MRDKELNRKAGIAGGWYAVANVLSKGCVFLTLPVFTRVLSTNDFGIYNAYIAYEQILQAIMGMGLYGTVKNAKLDYGHKFEEYLSSALFLSVIWMLIIWMSGNAFYHQIAPFLGFSRFVTNCLILQSFGAYLISFYGAKLNIEFQYKSYMAISCFNTVVNIAVSILLILFAFPNERYLGRILGSAFPLILISLFLCARIFALGHTLFSRNYWKYALSIGMPLVPHALSQSLLSQFDRIMIRDMTGNAEAGIYSYIYTICTITFVICSSFDNAWTPWVYMKLKSNRAEDIKKAGNYYALLFASLTLCFICVMPEITKAIADRSYWNGIDLLTPLALANYCIFLYMLPAGIEYYHKKTAYISFGTVFAAVLNLALNRAAIGLWGYKAAAYTTLLSYLALFLLHWGFSRKLGFETCYQLPVIMGISAALFAASALALLTYPFPVLGLLVRYSMTAAIACAFFMSRRFIVKIVKGND